MNLSRVHPRHDQVAELTRGQSLPLAPLHEIHLTLVAEVLRRAWNDLLVDRRSILLSGGETEVNTLIETRLNALLEEDRLWSLLVRAVVRGKETVSYDGSHLEKQPDLSILLTDRNPSFPLVVECKLIDAPSRKKIDLYCNDGLARFVRGEYGWATREAFMIAYVRDGSTISSCLEPFLAQSRTKLPDTYLTHALPESIGGSDMELARSHHHREFRYIDQSHDSPGTIAIWHLWIAAYPQ
jgi:hypothetical protein